MTASKKASDDFLAALQGEVEKTEKSTSAATAKRKAQEKLYAQTLKPIVEALAALPAKDGKKFSCDVSFIAPAWPQIEIMIVHHADDGKKPLEASHWEKICFSVSNFISPKSYYLYEKLEQRTVRTGQYHEISGGLAAAPAVLGQWVAVIAPNRLDELKDMLAPKKSTGRKAAAPKDDDVPPRRIKISGPLQYKKHP